MADQRTLMVVHAHPDDEVFSTGGILARARAEGHRAVVVYATNGEAGEMYDETLELEPAKARLGEIRQREARDSCRILGVEDVRFLGYRDSGMADTDENKNPAAFMNAPLDEAVERLVTVMRETRPQVVVTYDEGGGYGHPDHVMTNRVTDEAFRRAHEEPGGPQKLYHIAGSREGFRRSLEAMRELGIQPPWIRGDFDLDQYGKPDAEITAHIDIAPYVSLKKPALAVHRTQIKPDFYYLTLPDEYMQRYNGTEYFVRVHPPAATGEREDDLMAGTEGQAEAA